MGSRHRFFLEGLSGDPGDPVDLSPIARQLHQVLRLQPGSEIILLDNRGFEYLTRIVSLSRSKGMGQLIEKGMADGEPLIDLTLFCCPLKANRLEWVLQKGTEIGVTRFVPLISSRTIVRPASRLNAKLDRWRTIVQEAAEQSGRGRIPVVEEACDWNEAVEGGTEVRVLLWEEPHGDRPRSLFSLLSPLFSHPPSFPRISVLVGPEGGIAPEEASQAIEAGWTPVWLGGRILRAETASIVAATQILYGPWVEG